MDIALYALLGFVVLGGLSILGWSFFLNRQVPDDKR